jgi:hypothetical protein
VSAETLTVSLEELHPAQRKILDESRRFNVIACGRRFGKSVLGIDLAAETALDGGIAGWFAPEYKLLDEAWGDIKAILAPVIVRANDQQKRITLLTGGRIDAWSFDRNPNAGRSRKYHRVVIDEAAHCKSLRSAWSKAIRPTLTDFEGDAWFLSSPNGKGDFYALWQKGLAASGDWKSWQMPSYANPHLKASEIDSARDDLGPKFFAQEYLAEFVDDLMEALIPGAWLDFAAAARPWPGGSCRMSIDLAEGRDGDPAGVLVRDDNRVLAAEASASWGLEATATKAALLAQRHGVPGSRIVFDASGVGADFANRLDAVGLRGAVPYKGGASGGRAFTNLRTAAAWAMRQRLDPGTTVNAAGRAPIAQPAFSIPPELMPLFRAELAALRYTIAGDRRKALEPKEEMAAALGRSPTFCDLLLMSFSFPSM